VRHSTVGIWGLCVALACVACGAADDGLDAEVDGASAAEADVGTLQQAAALSCDTRINACTRYSSQNLEGRCCSCNGNGYFFGTASNTYTCKTNYQGCWGGAAGDNCVCEGRTGRIGRLSFLGQSWSYCIPT
jgi:hypothetical protein